MICRRVPKRRGALTVENAIVLPVMLFLVLMIIVGGIGVFRYQQVACLAREGSRWTAVRGSRWQLETGQTSPTQQDILQNAVLPLAFGMNTSQLSIQAQWIDGQTGAATPWDSSSKCPVSISPSSQGVQNRIRITVNYGWSPAHCCRDR